ncbi:MAG: quinone-dependent dihydroorotate dehydrogenase [Verrucomicrobiae bacterium]|nr:quinone-dependent dihydroorotate dehydrogenase [Verrucomicrobiae bacterium]
MPDFYKLARKILFRLDAETAHHLTLDGMRWAERFGMLGHLTGSSPGPNPVESEIEVMGLKFPNRVGLAAGLDKAGIAVDAFGTLGFGHVEVGTVTPRPQPGNDKPRLFRLIEHEAIINRMGFNNPGVIALLRNLAESRRKFQGVLGINIGKNFDTPNERALEDYLACFQGVYAAADYIAANLSSPNTKGLRDLQNVETCRELITVLQRAREELAPKCSGKQVPIAIKIAPDLSNDQIRDLADVFSECRIDGVIATNTTIARDAIAGHPRAAEAGGLSGRPVRQRSTEVISQLRKFLDPNIPIIGVGGILSGEDAREKIEAGAALVQVYSGLIYRGPALVREILQALRPV